MIDCTFHEQEPVSVSSQVTTQTRDLKKNTSSKMDQDNYIWLIVEEIIVLQEQEKNTLKQQTKQNMITT